MSQANIYGTTGRKSVNASRISGNTNSNSVLSERVNRIQEKINEIHVSLSVSNDGICVE